MSDHTKTVLQRVAALLGILAGIAGLLGAWFVLPYRMDAAEKAIREVQSESRSAVRELQASSRIDHDMLQRIDERTARMEKALDRSDR